ncbi:MAG: Ig-like domain-containing protein, partial [Treponema sp.]|nr:Ig-like domain-containing protein [Treponema sp.]
MRKGLFAALASLIIAGFVSCSSETDSGNGNGNGNGSGTSKSVTSVTLNHTTLELILGLDRYSSGTLTATVTGANLEDSDKGVTWTSSKESVATVTQAGVVAAVGEGNAVITAKSKYNPAKTATCTVVVTGSTVVSGWTWTATDYADGITADSTSITASTVMGNVTVSGSGAVWRTKNSAAYCLQTGTSTNGCLTFSLSEISKVVITAASTGSTNTSDAILSTTASTSGAVAEDSGATTVYSSSPITTLTYSNVPAGTYYFGAFPASSNSRGIRVYTITVTGTSSSGVTVVPPTAIALSENTLSFDLNDENDDGTKTLTYTLTPDNVTSGYDKVTWSTSDSSVAAVSSSGEVTAKKAGTAVITVTTDTGSFEDTCTVTVTGDAGKTISLTDTPEGYA